MAASHSRIQEVKEYAELLSPGELAKFVSYSNRKGNSVILETLAKVANRQSIAATELADREAESEYRTVSVVTGMYAVWRAGDEGDNEEARFRKLDPGTQIKFYELGAKVISLPSME